MIFELREQHQKERFDLKDRTLATVMTLQKTACQWAHYLGALDFSSALPEKERKDGLAVTPVTSCRRSYPGKLEAIYPAIAAALIGIKASCCTKPINEFLFSNVLQGIVND